METLCLHTAIGVDFNTPGTPRVIFPTSSTSGSQQCVNINITDDMIVEGHQQIVAGFDTGTETPLGQIDFSPSSSLITVMDNDGNVHVVENKSHKFCVLVCFERAGGRRDHTIMTILVFTDLYVIALSITFWCYIDFQVNLLVNC